MLDNLLCWLLSKWMELPRVGKLGIAFAVIVPLALLAGHVEATAPSGWYY
jgi:hypothetical protein